MLAEKRIRSLTVSNYLILWFNRGPPILTQKAKRRDSFKVYTPQCHKLRLCKSAAENFGSKISPKSPRELANSALLRLSKSGSILNLMTLRR